MNDRQMKSFLVVAEKGSLSMAAEQLFISVQALRQQIGLLEKDMGVRLFERNVKGVTLTPAGQCFLKWARQLIELQEACIHEMRSLHTEKVEDDLRIGVFLNPLRSVILNISMEFSKRFPKIKQELIPTPNQSALVFESLNKGMIDVFEYPYVSHRAKWLGFTPLYSSQLTCLLSPSHPLSQNPNLDIEDLGGQQVLLYERRYHPRLMTYLRKHNIHLVLGEYPGACLEERSELEISNITNKCLSGHIFLTTEEYSGYFPSLKRIPLNADIEWTFGLYHKKDPAPSVQLFIETAKGLFDSTS
ncbi:MAG TPA: LysR family transcriptional regulator [Terriglobales bacterium]|nr:LysR family transcriptional regulator [Terriglobales bacterium]